MPYLLFLQKQQNLKLSSAANCKLKVCNGIKQHQQLTCPYFFVGISSVGIHGFHSMVCRSRSYSLLVLVIPNGTAVPPKCRIWLPIFTTVIRTETVYRKNMCFPPITIILEIVLFGIMVHTGKAM